MARTAEIHFIEGGVEKVHAAKGCYFRVTATHRHYMLEDIDEELGVVVSAKVYDSRTVSIVLREK